MKFKKAQAMDPKELVLTLIMAGIIFIVSLLVFANVTKSTDSIFDAIKSTTTNESVTIISLNNGDNSTLLAVSGVIANTETVINATAPFIQLTRDVDYRITLTGGDGAIDTRANFTLLNVSNSSTNPGGFNNSALFVTYDTNADSAAKLSNKVIQNTVLDSFELGVIALIVLAAVVILAVLFRLGQ